VNYFEGNALTRPYYTSFVSVLPPALLASTVHSRMARLGRFENDSAVYSTEVGRVLAELERDMNGRFPAYKSLIALALGKSPRIADEVDLVRNTSRADLATAIASIYHPDNGVLVVAGDLNIDSTKAMIHETAARLKLDEVDVMPKSALPVPQLKMNQSAVIENQNRTGHNIVGIAWVKPPLGDKEQLPLLIADQLMLGRDTSISDPARSETSPIAIRLAPSLGGSSFWDGRAGSWAAPDLVDTGPGIQAIVFQTDRNLTIQEIRDSVTAALRDVRSNAMSDADIEAARSSLAAFYERWFFEPTYRVLADHLMAYASTGRDPALVKQIPSQIRRVKASDVRKAFDTRLLSSPFNIVILPK
jgi:predicted Zn-dependent peptidase